MSISRIFAGTLRNWRLVLLAGLVLCHPPKAKAWGPHPTITQAAMDVVGTNSNLARALGPWFLQLTNYCWMADYKRVPFVDVEADFYADDYLLFPEASTHLDHICPEVRKTYPIYFRRALQALRTESPANAARWIGALLHFVQDSGSPPHAAEIRGDVHVKMENWVDDNAIRLGSYRPRMLGAGDDDALSGLLARMDGLIAYSRERGLKSRLPVEIGNRSAVRPLSLECALETAQVTADLLLTLGNVGAVRPPGRAALVGQIFSRPPAGMERFPAKVILVGTSFSTLADGGGHFEFRDLAAGAYRVQAFRPGHSGWVEQSVTLKAGMNRLDLAMTNLPVNLLRNAGFTLDWIETGRPDYWTRTGLGWEGEIVPLKPAQTYELRVDFASPSAGDVFVRWTKQLPHTVPHKIPVPRIDSRPLTATNSTLRFTGSENMALLQVTVRTSQHPTNICRRITLVPVNGR